MTIDPAVLHGIMMASWSLKEAAYYVHNLDPTCPDVEIQPRSTSLPSKTYFWLEKELSKGRIHPVIDDGDEEPRFSPGTIMRHLDDKEKYFHKPVLNAYNNHGVSPGPSAANTKAKYIYMKAAKLIHAQYPSLPKTQVAKLLKQLPARMGDKSLPPYKAATIRKYLSTLDWPSKGGRPPKSEKIEPHIDWAALVKELS